MNFIEYYERETDRINNALANCFAKNQDNNSLLEAMRYSLLAGGKRIRPVLVLEFNKACGGREENAMPLACAVEMLHTYSLIHDDMPCMDNDELRRGMPTNHIVYGDWLAMLSGDALQAAAFETILSSDNPADIKSEAALILAEAAGANGMCGGQYLDKIYEKARPAINDLKSIHKKKTAALIIASCLIGCTAAGANQKEIEAAIEYAECIGLAFQILDDILDTESSVEEIGKPIGSDNKNGKTTFVSLLGINKCREHIAELTNRAVKTVESTYKDSGFLIWLAKMLASRKK